MYKLHEFMIIISIITAGVICIPLSLEEQVEIIRGLINDTQSPFILELRFKAGVTFLIIGVGTLVYYAIF